ncbi:MAG: cobalamin-independent methionine synthase II family protein [Rhodospirillaceae bacterium]|nr:cobalamin-independent methionine synthase II family protein [Rhodospirillaceae bacterium]MBL6930918.1 cobalamin-independent methionine synthase II family protein [Rhodospirillales bacterium]
MALLTTTIGAYPKPDYVPVVDWFRAEGSTVDEDPTSRYEDELARMGDKAEAIFARAARDVIDDQVSCGIDIPTDGEVRRENYIHYHCRHLNGIDFATLTDTVLRGGAYKARLPTITGPVSAMDHFLPHDYRVAQATTDKSLKVTIPGPMTIGDTVADTYYGDEKKRGQELATALNSEVLALAEAGCRHIQIDEPLFARKAEAALDFGIENLERVFHGCPENVTRTMHMCCGYPDCLDDTDYPKAPKESYLQLARAIDASSIQVVSLEDAHRHNDLSLLELFEKTTIIFGVVAIASSRIESMEEIRQRLEAALGHIDAHRLIAAPDCGLGMLSRDMVMAKLGNLCTAAHSLG